MKMEMFTVKTSEILQSLKHYKSFKTPEDIHKDVEEKKLNMLYERTLFFTEKPASYTVYYTTNEPIVEYVVLLTIGDDVYVYAFNDYKLFDYALEASAAKLYLEEEFYIIVSPLYDTIAIYDNNDFWCGELVLEQVSK